MTVLDYSRVSSRSPTLESSPKSCRLVIEPHLLQRVDRIPYQPFELLDLGLPLRDGGILTRPLTNQRPGRTVFVEQSRQVLLAG
jgi:hypothetical protein